MAQNANRLVGMASREATREIEEALVTTGFGALGPQQRASAPLQQLQPQFSLQPPLTTTTVVVKRAQQPAIRVVGRSHADQLPRSLSPQRPSSPFFVQTARTTAVMHPGMQNRHASVDRSFAGRHGMPSSASIPSVPSGPQLGTPRSSLKAFDPNSVLPGPATIRTAADLYAAAGVSPAMEHREVRGPRSTIGTPVSSPRILCRELQSLDATMAAPPLKVAGLASAQPEHRSSRSTITPLTSPRMSCRELQAGLGATASTGSMSSAGVVAAGPGRLPTPLLEGGEPVADLDASGSADPISELRVLLAMSLQQQQEQAKAIKQLVRDQAHAMQEQQRRQECALEEQQRRTDLAMQEQRQEQGLAMQEQRNAMQEQRNMFREEIRELQRGCAETAVGAMREAADARTQLLYRSMDNPNGAPTAGTACTSPEAFATTPSAPERQAPEEQLSSLSMSGRSAMTASPALTVGSPLLPCTTPQRSVAVLKTNTPWSAGSAVLVHPAGVSPRQPQPAALPTRGRLLMPREPAPVLPSGSGGGGGLGVSGVTQNGSPRSV